MQYHEFYNICYKKISWDGGGSRFSEKQNEKIRKFLEDFSACPIVGFVFSVVFSQEQSKYRKEFAEFSIMFAEKYILDIKEMEGDKTDIACQLVRKVFLVANSNKFLFQSDGFKNIQEKINELPDHYLKIAFYTELARSKYAGDWNNHANQLWCLVNKINKTCDTILLYKTTKPLIDAYFKILARQTILKNESNYSPNSLA